MRESEEAQLEENQWNTAVAEGASEESESGDAEVRNESEDSKENPTAEQKAEEESEKDPAADQKAGEESEGSPTADQEAGEPSDKASEGKEKSSGRKGKAAPTEKFAAFLKELEGIDEPENKLKRTIEFMEEALSQENGVPHFKNFWDARDVCLKLFKENLPHQVREVFWGRYSELSKEARRLKDILDEQSAFAMEQIEIAITALEEEIASIDSQRKDLEPIRFDIVCHTLQNRFGFYGSEQGELNLLNAYAARINSLRKELIKTDMRIRHKNKFFQRLSTAGDSIFPRRKELIASISQSFIKDVDTFIGSMFDGDRLNDASHVLRDEIKAMQAMAKVLTLNTQAFTATRGKLSEGWDKLKEISKERKKVRLEQKAELRENADALKVKIDEVAKAFADGSKTVAEAQKELEAISTEMRGVKLGRDEVRFLRDALKEARTPINQKLEEENKRREEQQQELERQRREKVEQLKEEIDTLITGADSVELDDLVSRRDDLRKKIQQSDFHKLEKRELETLLKPLADSIQDKKEQALLNLSDDDQKSLQQLREVLATRNERRSEIKDQLEIYRKEVGSSGLDFEKAMAINEQINIEKERLEKIDSGIEEIEEKIEELENKVY